MGGPGGHGLAHVSRPDRRLRALPRSQVRSDHACAITTRWPASSRARAMVNKTAGWPRGKGDGKADRRWIPRHAAHRARMATPQNLNVFMRGDVERKGPVVERRFLEVLAQRRAARVSPTAAAGANSPRASRAATIRSPRASWSIACGRIFFGAPLVSHAEQLRPLRHAPTHPELLDDLARALHGERLVGEGAGPRDRALRDLPPGVGRRYAQGAAAIRPTTALAHEPPPPHHRAVARCGARASAANSRSRRGAKSLELDDPDQHRRTVYARVSRLKLNDLLMQFDYPDANVHAEKRSVTTTPMQKLFVLNSPFMQRRAAALRRAAASRRGGRRRRASPSPTGCCSPASPTTRNGAGARNFLRARRHLRHARWEQYAQVLLASNEMLYVD